MTLPQVDELMKDLTHIQGTYTVVLSQATTKLREAIAAWVEEKDPSQRAKRWSTVLDTAKDATDAREAFRRWIAGLPTPTNKRPTRVGR